VLRVFEAHCTPCHGPTLKKPKGKFGYVTDLARLRANADLIVPFEPDRSELFLLVRDGEMPPPESDIAPPSVAQKQTVRRWIEAGAPPPAPPAEGSSTPDTSTDGGAATGPGWLGRIGRLHPASVHLPIGMMLGALLAELLFVVGGRDTMRSAARFCTALGALSIVAAALLGWWNAEVPLYAIKNRSLLGWHRWLGVSTAVLCVATVVSLWWSERRTESARARIVYRVLLALAAVLTLTTGFLGGLNVYGWEHYFPG